MQRVKDDDNGSVDLWKRLAASGDSGFSTIWSANSAVIGKIPHLPACHPASSRQVCVLAYPPLRPSRRRVMLA
jgi:hypothetical protein